MITATIAYALYTNLRGKNAMPVGAGS